jgi:predicted ArsR family transcriptional regulator
MRREASTNTGDLDQQIRLASPLRDPVRRNLYLYVVRSGGEVGREEAARSVGISRALAAFHLDRLAREGLLRVTARRISGRKGPGAGRPAKLYARSSRQVSLTIPPRSYGLAADLLACAVEITADGTAASGLDAAARARGLALGRQLGAGERAGGQVRDVPSPGDAPVEDRAQGEDVGVAEELETATAVLLALGFEPFRNQAGEILLRNCPFDELARDHRELVCGMNLSLLRGLIEGLRLRILRAELDPQPGMCCVVIRIKTRESGHD